MILPATPELDWGYCEYLYYTELDNRKSETDNNQREKAAEFTNIDNLVPILPRWVAAAAAVVVAVAVAEVASMVAWSRE